MKTCPYCGTKVALSPLSSYCSFCEMQISRGDLQDYGKRKNFLPASQPSLSDLNKSTAQLMNFSTVELLFLLKFARKERADIYQQRYVFIQAMKEGANEFSGAEQYAFLEYERATRKCFVLENLVRERMGYYPSKLTDSYIQTLAARMEESVKKDMVIQQPKPI
ncbi:hypothetical protein P4361_18575 [Fictibacillus sp. B-59209]|uniref:hypothetical protein n=1 Tax=Fictibacillus sp. B-59209 TaxID=3024873 RepID=UPI002E23FEF4|nr:hypothetical protein [Fictibacillus sp. B-59209]